MKKFSYEILVEKLFKSEPSSTMELGAESSLNRHRANLTGAVRQGLENLLTNLKKLIEKEKKRKMDDEKSAKKSSRTNNLDLVSIYTTNSNKTVATNINEIEDLLKESDSEEEDVKDSKSHKSSKSNKTSKSGRKEDKKTRVKGDKMGLAWLQENETDDPLDLLDPMAIKRVLATKPLTKDELEKKKLREENSKYKNRGFKMSNDGKLVIDDEDGDDEDFDEKKSKHGKKKRQPGEIEEMMDTLSLSKKSMAASKKSTKKRGLDDEDDSDAEDTKSKFSYKSGGHGIHRRVEKDNSNKKVDFGSEYRAKKARGDMKLKNKPDPFAYIPFNFSKLNKRKKAKLQGEFKGVVKAVQRGAQKGSKKMKK